MKASSYLRQFAGSVLSRRNKLLKRSYLLPSVHLGRDVLIDVYRPAVPPWRLVQLAVFNDGQDFKRMRMKKRLKAAYRAGTLKPTVVVGVHAGDRLREYGSSARTDDQGRGDRAGAYEKFVCEELYPYLLERNNIFHDPRRRAVAGFSLGGLSAFDLAWRRPNVFGTAGVFSGALWYRTKPFDPARPDANRLVHGYVGRSKRAPNGRFWFMAGTDDETSDRNNNGIIDAIDDTLQLLALLREKGFSEEQLAYVEVEGGRHEPETWGEVVIDFLRWI